MLDGRWGGGGEIVEEVMMESMGEACRCWRVQSINLEMEIHGEKFRWLTSAILARDRYHTRAHTHMHTHTLFQI